MNQSVDDVRRTRIVAELDFIISERNRLREQQALSGPYSMTQWTDEVRHVEPCDCHLDDESVGPGCMENSEWFYVVTVEGQRVIVRLPREAPPPCENGHETPIVAVGCCEDHPC